MSNGIYKNINNLKIGDEIMSFPNRKSKITHIINTNIKKQIDMCKLTNKNNTKIFEYLICNKNYP